ncbi:MAG: hypothetical protein WC820_00565 [Spirochaetales bacterium]
MKENEFKEKKMEFLSMRDDRNALAYKGALSMRVSFETPQVIELGDVSERVSYTGLSQ